MKNFYFIRLFIAILLFGSQISFVNAQTRFKSLNFLYSISGIKTVAGIHNREPNNNPSLWTDSITVLSGNTPGLWSGDFLFSKNDVEQRWKMIYEAEDSWNKGSLVNLMWHCCSPLHGEPCHWDGEGVLDKMSDEDWLSLIKDGEPLNLVWKSRLDDIATYLKYLESKNVEVLFRPFHEMNQPVFWWAGRKGINGTVKLYQITHDYLTKTKGLKNLIWLWDLQDFNTLVTDLIDYNPGKEYWDVLALDMYGSDGTNYTIDKYNAIVKTAGSKPIAIGECQVLPTPTILKSQPKWTFFMSWAELTVKHNTKEAISGLYQESNVITLDEMQGWNNKVQK